MVFILSSPWVFPLFIYYFRHLGTLFLPTRGPAPHPPGIDINNYLTKQNIKKLAVLDRINSILLSSDPSMYLPIVLHIIVVTLRYIRMYSCTK